MFSPAENEENKLPKMEKARMKSCIPRIRCPLKDASNTSIDTTSSGGTSEILAKIRDLEISDESIRWPKKINSHVRRFNVDLQRENLRNNGGEVRFNEKSEICIICQKNDDETPLISCQGFMNGFTIKSKNKPKCKSMFHFDCITTYNASDYCIQYIAQPECQNEILCPLHFCDTCFLERRKQTAFRGTLIECVECLRAFHYEQCPPIGSKDLELTMCLDEPEGEQKYKVEMIICPAHRAPKEIKQSSHIKMCCECEDLNSVDDLIQCRVCIRSFHAQCRAAVEIDGNTIVDNLCEFCLTGECVRCEVPVIARWSNNRFYPGLTRFWEACPMPLRKTPRYDQLGYCVIEWKGEEKSTFSIISISDCVPLFGRSLKLLGRNLKPITKKAWRDLINNLDEYLKFDPILKKVRRKIETSKYFENNGEKLYSTCEGEKYICDCKKDGGDHCGTDKCSNRREYYECPPECSTESGRCLNRGISDKEVHPNIVERGTESKGYGVFAKGPIKCGEFIAEYAGEIITRKEVDKRNNLLHYARDAEANLYMMQLNNGRAVDAARAGNIARYINHSCDPNCQTVKRTILLKERKNEVTYDHRIAVVSIRDINAGEELSFKYQMDDWMNSEAPNCKCGAANCVGSLGKEKIVEDFELEEEDDEEEDLNETSSKKGSKNKRKSNGQIDNLAKRSKSNPETLMNTRVFLEKFCDFANQENPEEQRIVKEIMKNSKSLKNLSKVHVLLASKFFAKKTATVVEVKEDNSSLENSDETNVKEEIDEIEANKVEQTAELKMNELRDVEIRKNPPRKRDERIFVSPSPPKSKAKSRNGSSTSSNLSA